MARKYAQGPQSSSESDPINLPELREFYGDDLEDVLQTYVTSTEGYIASINQAIVEKDDEMVARYAHELKGSSASVGAKQLAKLALFLERSAGIRDWKEAKETTEALINAFNSARVFLEKSPTLSNEVVILPIRD